MWGLVVGLVLGLPAGAALKVAGYPNDGLYPWLAVLGVAFGATVIAALLMAVRRRALAGGLVVGATVSLALAPVLVVLDIVSRSA